MMYRQWGSLGWELHSSNFRKLLSAITQGADTDRVSAPCALLPLTEEERSGADRDRTDDLLYAIQALSQLSYGPVVRPLRAWEARVAEADSRAEEGNGGRAIGQTWGVKSNPRGSERASITVNQARASSSALEKTSSPCRPTNLLTTSPFLRRTTVGID